MLHRFLLVLCCLSVLALTTGCSDSIKDQPHTESATMMAPNRVTGGPGAGGTAKASRPAER